MTNFEYTGSVVRVIDADTLVLNLDLGFRVHVEIEGRINGVDAPELSTPEGQHARAEIVTLVNLAKFVTVKSFKDHRTFARWVVDVKLNGVDDLASYLIDKGFVKSIARLEHA